MNFASPVFILFFAVVLAGAAIFQRMHSLRPRQVFLLLASYFFYGWWDWRFCFLLLFVTVTSYLTALAKDNKVTYTAGVVVPLVVLGFFKYFNFFLGSASALLGRDLGTLRIILPVGISFYTFQALSYVIDVHRGKLPVERDFIRLALYLSFFPQLVAGPIVRAADFLPQLKEDRQVTIKNLETGIQLIAFGLFKKIVLADHMSVFVDDVFYAPAAFHWATILLAVVSYSIQIYFDFSGYSDIAIGCARCLGYDFRPNFDLPYVSQNVTEFWKRWHISLSTWLKEYLYIPLGGNRKGTLRRYINLMLTMLLGGLWHGANWTFVFWGGLHGAALVLDKLRPRREHGVAGGAVGTILTFAFVSFAWIFFRAETFADAWTVILGVATFQDGIRQPFIWSFVSIAILCICTFAAARKTRFGRDSAIHGRYPVLDLNTVRGLTLFFTLCGLILGLAYTGENPFVYFQF